MDESFMKEKPVFSLLLTMALPMVISMLVNSLYNIIDSYFVARMGEDAITALSLVYPVQNAVNAVAIGFGVGINAIIANYNGAGEKKKANKAATQGLVLSWVHGVVMTVVCLLIMPAFLRMFTSSDIVLSYGLRYSRIVFSFALVTVTNLSFEKIFQSVGRMRVTMVGLMIGCVSNIILDPILIFGTGPFPVLGIEGAAIATVLGQSFTVIFYLIIYLVRPMSVRLGLQYLAREKGLAGRLYSVGIPAALNLALPSVLITALNAILVSFSQTFVVILGIYYKLQTFLYLPANGFVQGMRPIIGYNYGAGEYGRVRKIYQYTLVMNVLIMLVGTALCLLIPRQLMGLYTVNPDTIDAGVTALRVICAGFIVSAVSVTSSGALEGLGKGIPSFVISLFRYVGIILPAAYLLSRLVGPVGVWNAFWIAEAATACIAYVIYKRSVPLR